MSLKTNGVQLVPASPAHVGRIASKMRAIDKAECAARGRAPKAALRLALRSSVWALTAFVDGEPEAMFGISPICTITDRGCPWFLGSDRVMRHGRDMLLIGTEVIEHMHRHSRRLENSVSVDNLAAVRLLRRWGFTIGEQPYERGGIRFVRFWRDLDHV